MNRSIGYVAVITTALLLAACQKTALRKPAVVIEPTPLPVEEVLPPKAPRQTNAAYDNLADYKRAAAEQIVQASPDAIFAGALPPMLPAIVVVEIKIGHEGEIVSLRVVRSRDQQASDVALAAVRKALPLPKPHHLLPAHHKTLDFAETFLFNKDYRFQLRTLSGPQ
ncbi:MAG: hypothetical protein V4724_38690 [Pseudomonadota bacterium]